MSQQHKKQKSFFQKEDSSFASIMYEGKLASVGRYNAARAIERSFTTNEKPMLSKKSIEMVIDCIEKSGVFDDPIGIEDINEFGLSLAEEYYASHLDFVEKWYYSEEAAAKKIKGRKLELIQKDCCEAAIELGIRSVMKYLFEYVSDKSLEMPVEYRN